MALAGNFVQAKSDNLPKVDRWMVAEFFAESDCFSVAEIRGVKEISSGRDSYIESAIGYVDLCRENNICTVRCKICPEHKVKAKNYAVTLKVDEDLNKVLSVTCMDCTASLGGCKHAVAFLMWLNKKSEEPAPTTVESYWRKPSLSNVTLPKNFLTMADFGAKPLTPAKDEAAFVEDVLQTLIQNVDCGGVELLKMFKDKSDVQMLDLHLILINFVEDCGKDFFEYSANFMSDKLCEEAEKLTRDQYKSPFWFKLRYGRITASKIYDVAHCKKEDGVIIEQIISAYKLRETEALERGRVLENAVLKVVEKKLNKKFEQTGLILNKIHPVLGASPDGMSEEYVIEIKCPFAEKSVSRYMTEKKQITAKYNAQIQLQMYMLGKQKGLFCVADPEFEKNKQVNIIKVDFDEQFTKDLIKKAETKKKKYWDSDGYVMNMHKFVEIVYFVHYFIIKYI